MLYKRINWLISPLNITPSFDNSPPQAASPSMSICCTSSEEEEEEELEAEAVAVAAESKYGRQWAMTLPPGPCLMRVDMVWYTPTLPWCLLFWSSWDAYAIRTATHSVLITSSYFRVRAREDNNASTDFFKGQFLSLTGEGEGEALTEEGWDEEEGGERIGDSQNEEMPRTEISVRIRIKWGREFSGSMDGSILSEVWNKEGEHKKCTQMMKNEQEKWMDNHRAGQDIATSTATS